MNPLRVVTFDLDSTLADTRCRDRTLLDAGYTKEAALEYAQQCPLDVPNPAGVLLWEWAVNMSYARIIVTSRPSAVRSETLRWLLQHNLMPHELHMETGHTVDTTLYKVAVIRRLQERYNVVAHVDDWPGVRPALRDLLGIPAIILTPEE